MDARRIPVEEVLGKCAWCGKTIPKDSEVFALGGKKRPGIDLAEYEGGAIRIALFEQNRDVAAIVPSADSQACRDGRDFMFMVCSETCGSELKAALEVESALGNALFGAIKRMMN